MCDTSSEQSRLDSGQSESSLDVQEYEQSSLEQAPADVCMICGQTDVDGIHILTRFICTLCEQEIVRIRAEDERYRYFVQRLRQLWRDIDTSGAGARGSDCS